MELFADPLVEGWKPESVIWEVALKEGYSLDSLVEQVESLNEPVVWQLTDSDRGQHFYICLEDRELDTKWLSRLDLQKDQLFVCRDTALTDDSAANLALQCRLKTV